MANGRLIISSVFRDLPEYHPVSDTAFPVPAKGADEESGKVATPPAETNRPGGPIKTMVYGESSGMLLVYERYRRFNILTFFRSDATFAVRRIKRNYPVGRQRIMSLH